MTIWKNLSGRQGRRGARFCDAHVRWNVSGPLKTAIDRLFALPFNIRQGGHALEGKKLQMLLTSGQPSSGELQAELESMGRKMCAFTGMEWLGILAGGNTGEVPLADDAALLEKAFQAGAALK